MEKNENIWNLHDKLNTKKNTEIKIQTKLPINLKKLSST